MEASGGGAGFRVPIMVHTMSVDVLIVQELCGS